MNSSKENKKIAAFFDLDNTILVGTNSLLLYVKYLLKIGKISRWQVCKGIFFSLLHRLNLLNVEKVMDAFAEPYQGMNEAELIAITRPWFKKDVIPFIAQEIKERISWHHSQGHLVYLLSSATQYVCLPVAEYLGMDGSIHSHVEVRNGILTGKIHKPLCFQEGKIFHAKNLAKIQGIQIEYSYFYTDSVSDLPMLEIVAFPIAVNPDPLLRRHAKKNAWTIEEWSLS